MKKLFFILLFLKIGFNLYAQNCSELADVPIFVSKSIMDNDQAKLFLKDSNPGYLQETYCFINGKNRYYNNIYPFEGKLKLSVTGGFTKYENSKARYKVFIYKIPFRNQISYSYQNAINTTASTKIFESSLIDIVNNPDDDFNRIDFEKEINVEQNFTYYAEISYQSARKILNNHVFGLPKRFKTNTVNVRYNCFPKLNYTFNGKNAEHGGLIEENLSKDFNIKIDLDNTINCGKVYFISIEESDQWAGRNSNTQVGKWLSDDEVNNNVNFNLKNFYANYNKYFQQNKYYRVEIAIGNPYLTKIIILKVN